MKTVNMHEAKTHLSALVQDLREGAEREIVICIAGRPAARLLPVAPASSGRRTLGIDAGSVRILPEFDEMDEQIAHTFNEV